MQKQYTAALRDYVQGGGGEAALIRGYEVGHKAVADGLGLLELVTFYQEGLATILSGALGPDERGRAVQAAGEFFLESLGPFEMTYRGVQWAHNMLVQVNEKLREINADLEAFSSTISHDLRAPLRHMQGFAQALLEDYTDQLDSVAKDYVRRIVTASQRMDALIQDLLAYSRISRADVELGPVSWGSIIEEILAQMDSEVRNRGASVSIQRPFPRVLGHRPALQQVLTNLLTNAMKFVARGVKPEIRIWADEEGDWTRLWVEDNGIGIAPEQQGTIFEPFQRLNDSESYPGSGVGLAIVAKAVAKMGGRVGVESASGRGSKFRVELKKISEED